METTRGARRLAAFRTRGGVTSGGGARAGTALRQNHTLPTFPSSHRYSCQCPVPTRRLHPLRLPPCSDPGSSGRPGCYSCTRTVSRNRFGTPLVAGHRRGSTWKNLANLEDGKAVERPSSLAHSVSAGIVPKGPKPEASSFQTAVSSTIRRSALRVAGRLETRQVDPMPRAWSMPKIMPSTCKDCRRWSRGYPHSVSLPTDGPRGTARFEIDRTGGRAHSPPQIAVLREPGVGGRTGARR